MWGYLRLGTVSLNRARGNAFLARGRNAALAVPGAPIPGPGPKPGPDGALLVLGVVEVEELPVYLHASALQCPTLSAYEHGQFYPVIRKLTMLS